MSHFFSFFFQAEDGIRDPLVTGVQTCALPISIPRQPTQRLPTQSWQHSSSDGNYTDASGTGVLTINKASSTTVVRSEERRVGKECRSRWWPCSYNEKTCREQKEAGLRRHDVNR